MSTKLYWSITDICNLHCRYCYYNAGLERKDSKFISRENFLRVIDDLSSNFEEFILTGGEVFGHKDVFFFLKELKKRHKKVGILTNATLLDDSNCRKIIDIGVDSIAVSIDSLDSQTNNYLRGQTNKVMASLHSLIAHRTHNVGLEIMMTVSRRNISSIIPVLNFCHSNNLNLWLDPIDIDYKCSSPDLIELDLMKLNNSEQKELYKNLAEWSSNDPILKNYVKNCKSLLKCLPPKIISCPMGTTSIVLDPDGTLYPCFLRKDLPLGNVFEDKTRTLLDKFSQNPQITSLMQAKCVRLGCVCMTIANNYQPYV